MITRILTIFAATWPLMAAGTVMAEGDVKPKSNTRAEIPFANRGGINDWRADSDHVLYVQGRNRQWYRAELFTDCIGLNFAENIGFVVEPSGTFDRFSAIVVEHRECKLRSLEKSDKPPSKKEKAAAAAAKKQGTP